MEGEQKVKLFREKSLEAIESPESLNDYLKVTSAGVWLIMAAVIVILAGFIVWGIFGRIDTTVRLAVSSDGGRTVCYVPYDQLQAVSSGGSVEVDGRALAVKKDAEVEVVIVSEDMNPYLRVAGGLEIGDMTVEVPLEGGLEDGIYTASAVTESLQPIALLLQ